MHDIHFKYVHGHYGFKREDDEFQVSLKESIDEWTLSEDCLRDILLLTHSKVLVNIDRESAWAYIREIDVGLFPCSKVLYILYCFECITNLHLELLGSVCLNAGSMLLVTALTLPLL